MIEGKMVTAATRRRSAQCAGCLLLMVLGFAAASFAQEQQTDISRKLTLKDAVRLAVSNSRDIKLAQLQYGLLQREAGVTRSVFRPNFYTGTGAAYTSGFPLLQGGGVPAIFNLSYNQEIFDPPLKGEQHAAEKRAEGQRLSMEGVRDGVMVRAALEYLELAKVRHALQLMRDERLSAGKILETTRQRAQAGRELPIEVIRSQLVAARIEQRLAKTEDREDSLAGDLRNLMGLDPDVPIEVSTEDIPAAATAETKDLVAQALVNNVDVQQAEIEVQARTAKLKGERGGYWPTVALTGQYNVLSKINNYTDFFNKFQRNNVIFGLEVRIPIFASRTSAAVAFAKADLDAADLALQKKRGDLSLDVRQKSRQVREADLGGDVAHLELQLAQEGLRVLQAQFDQGRATLKDLESAHLDENDKWLAYLDANYTRQQAQLELLRTTGGVSKILQ
jgi:outer membrane protein